MPDEQSLLVLRLQVLLARAGISPGVVDGYWGDNVRAFDDAGRLLAHYPATVGSVWIDLSKPTYGLHGTDDPAMIGKQASHGCVRMTNWDAEALAERLEKGVPLTFVE